MSYPDEVLADDPVVYYRMSESSGAPQDFSGNGFHIDGVNGTAGYSQEGAIVGNTAINVTGTQWFTRTHDEALSLLDVFTLECWVKLNAIPGGGTFYGLISKGWNGGANGTHYLRIDPGGVLGILCSNVGGIASATVSISDTNTFHHCVATKNGSTSTNLYLDGVDVTGTVTNVPCSGTTETLNICSDRFFGTDLPNLKIDEVALYPTPLSSSRVLAHFQEGTAEYFYPPPPIFRSRGGR